MASTPLSLWMNSDATGGGSLNSTPKPVPSRTNSPIKSNLDLTSAFALSLRSVLGTTTTSANGFDYLRSHSCFATCAGSAAVIHHVDEAYNITQKFFRAKPHGSTGSLDFGATPSTPEARSRPAAIRTSIYGGLRGLPSPSTPSDPAALQAKGSTRQKTRAATCVSLSRDGKLLAVGEVCYSVQL